MAILYLLFNTVCGSVFSQVTPPVPIEPPPVVEQQLENLTEASDDAITEDDSYLQELEHFTRDPVNLNYADEGQLEQLRLLSPLQISNLILYRKSFGNFISIYELQAVPDWDVSLIKKILPYITVSAKLEVFNSLVSRLKNGRNSVLIRGIQILEKSRGYLLKNTAATNFYPGSPQRILFRYKYSFKNLLQYGVTGEKDAGEQFFKGAQKYGFDFYSAHFFVRRLGIIKSLAIGDFTVSMGQGLTQWGSLAFNKGGDPLNIKRQSDVLRPYNSAGEIAFNRGIGITLQKNNWETTAFVSYRKLDANFHVDTLNYEDFVSSLQNTGYHRTASEVADKNAQGQLSFGGNISFSTERFHLGVNGVHYNLEYTIKKPEYLYNAYALSGKIAGNYSIDYSYTYRNIHLFGELATDEDMEKAFINGVLISVDPHVDMSFLYRNISRGYQSLYTNAFTENTFPTNESGFYSGISITPVNSLRIDGYADYFHFPWLKYRVDAPSSGRDYLVQLTYTPNKLVQVYTRFRTGKKPINYNPVGLTLNPLISQPKQYLRTQFSYKLNTVFTFRSRVELSWFDKKASDAENGFLMFADVMYKPKFKTFSGNIRIQYFETDGYNSRLYAYENDVLYGYSIPVFYSKGFRYYLNFNFDINKNFSLWGRFAQTVYPDKNIIGSGLDLITGHTKSEITLQAIWNF